MRCLTETLGGEKAIWTICSLMLSRAPEAQLKKDSNPFVEALHNYQLIHIEAYVVHVDLVLQHEVAFKLTKDSIATLIDYHKNIYLVDVAADTWHWNEKEAQIKKLHDEFVRSINHFVYRTHATALEGLEEDGAGELLLGRANDVKNQIMGLFLPLLPPPPRVVELVRPPPLLPSSSPAMSNWQQQQQMQHQMQQQQHQHQQAAPIQPAPVEAWKIVPSTPEPTIATTAEASQSIWASLGVPEILGLPSPAPSYSQPYSQGHQIQQQQQQQQQQQHSTESSPIYSQPFVSQTYSPVSYNAAPYSSAASFNGSTYSSASDSSASMYSPVTYSAAPYTTAPYTPAMSISTMSVGDYAMTTGMSLPSMYPQTCGAGAMGGFEWDGYRADVTMI
jgi:hypothetical protein